MTPVPPSRRNSRFATAAGVVAAAVCCFLIYLVVSGQWLNVLLGNGFLLPYSNEGYRQTFQDGDSIIAALERWRAAHGEYPDKLSDLVPSELSRIPHPQVGSGRWQYDRPEPGRFVLDFFVGQIYEHDWFDSAEGVWRGDH